MDMDSEALEGIDSASKIWGNLLTKEQMEKLGISSPAKGDNSRDSKRLRTDRRSDRKHDRRASSDSTSTTTVPTEVLGTLCRLVLRHEDTLNSLLSESQFLLHLAPGQGSILPLMMETSRTWHQQTEKTIPLRHLLAQTMIQELERRLKKLMEAPPTEALFQDCKSYHLVRDDTNRTMPFLRWSHQRRCLEPTEQPCLPITEVHRSLQNILRLLTDHRVTLRFHSLKRIGDSKEISQAVPWVWTVAQRHDPELWHEVAKLAFHSSSQLIQVRLRPQGLERTPLAKQLQKAMWFSFPSSWTAPAQHALPMRWFSASVGRHFSPKDLSHPTGDMGMRCYAQFLVPITSQWTSQRWILFGGYFWVLGQWSHLGVNRMRVNLPFIFFMWCNLNFSTVDGSPDQRCWHRAMRLSDRKKDTDSLQCHFHTLTTQPQNVSCKHLLIFGMIPKVFAEQLRRWAINLFCHWTDSILTPVKNAIRKLAYTHLALIFHISATVPVISLWIILTFVLSHTILAPRHTAATIVQWWDIATCGWIMKMDGHQINTTHCLRLFYVTVACFGWFENLLKLTGPCRRRIPLSFAASAHSRELVMTLGWTMRWGPSLDAAVSVFFRPHQTFLFPIDVFWMFQPWLFLGCIGFTSGWLDDGSPFWHRMLTCHLNAFHAASCTLACWLPCAAVRSWVAADAAVAAAGCEAVAAAGSCERLCCWLHRQLMTAALTESAFLFLTHHFSPFCRFMHQVLTANNYQ